MVREIGHAKNDRTLRFSVTRKLRGSEDPVSVNNAFSAYKQTGAIVPRNKNSQGNDVLEFLNRMQNPSEEMMSEYVAIVEQYGVEELKFILWEATGWHERQDPLVLGEAATDEQKSRSRDMYTEIYRVILKVVRETASRIDEKIRTAEEVSPDIFYNDTDFFN